MSRLLSYRHRVSEKDYPETFYKIIGPKSDGGLLIFMLILCFFIELHPLVFTFQITLAIFNFYRTKLINFIQNQFSKYKIELMGENLAFK